MTRKLLTIVLGALAASLVTAGCASNEIGDVNRRLVSIAELQKKAPNATYVVDPPDSIRIEFLNDATLTREVQVRQDGCVTLPYLKDVKVSGLHTEQIAALLEDAYTKFYKTPQILVTVTQYKSKRVYVYGEVGREGTFPYTGQQTVRSIIGDAGGFTHRAAPTRVTVTRSDIKTGGDTKANPEVFTVDLKQLLYEGKGEQDVSLAEDDVVRVPPNVLAWIGYQLQNLLFPFQSIFSTVITAETANNVVHP